MEYLFIIIFVMNPAAPDGAPAADQYLSILVNTALPRRASERP